MRLLILFLALIVESLNVFSQENNEGLPRFKMLTKADGLLSDSILHILQLDDGRMVITTDSCINIIDGDSVRQFHVKPHSVYNIRNYTGHYHVYSDTNDNIWVKDNGTVWCINLKTGQYVSLDNYKITDLFVDSEHKLWMVNDTVVGHDIIYRSEWGQLQDLDTDSTDVFLFFSSSKVACYDIDSQKLKYTTEPYDTAEAKFYNQTSLVVKGKDKCFYQLRCGESRYIFLKFNPRKREWRTIFETNKGVFHTLCVPNDKLALITCPQGLWEINLDTGEMQLHSQVITTEGDTLHTGFNTVYCDDKGGIWLGTYNDGVLYADGLHAKKSYFIYYCTALLILLIISILFVFHQYALRQRKREHKLMERLREMTATASMLEKQTEDKQKSNIYKTDENGRTMKLDDEKNENSEFVMRAIEMVKLNMNTPGYSVERLAADLCMERTGLYKKLTAILDQTPTLFIRNIRLQHAAEMLKEGQLTISEIAEKAGFSSPSYFSKQFQETYGCKPSEYGK